MITLNRFYSDADSTVGNLILSGKGWQCFIVEDQHQDAKVYGETRIPAGQYKLTPREHGGFYQQYTQRWAWHRGMIELSDVPSFTDILIHPGNTHLDTKGCLLPNYGVNIVNRKIVGGTASVPAYERLYREIIDSVYNGTAEIVIVDSDRSHRWG
jgi:hypothetical protein